MCYIDLTRHALTGRLHNSWMRPSSTGYPVPYKHTITDCPWENPPEIPFYPLPPGDLRDGNYKVIDGKLYKLVE